MSANKLLGIANSASWKVMKRPRRTTFAPIFISFSRKFVGDLAFYFIGRTYE